MDKEKVTAFKFGAEAVPRGSEMTSGQLNISLKHIPWPRREERVPRGVVEKNDAIYHKLCGKACEECPIADKPIVGLNCSKIGPSRYSDDAEIRYAIAVDEARWKELLATASCHPHLNF